MSRVCLIKNTFHTKRLVRSSNRRSDGSVQPRMNIFVTSSSFPYFCNQNTQSLEDQAALQGTIFCADTRAASTGNRLLGWNRSRVTASCLVACTWQFWNVQQRLKTRVGQRWIDTRFTAFRLFPGVSWLKNTKPRRFHGPNRGT